jgi:DNA-binding MarR family transcriptional regulator
MIPLTEFADRVQVLMPLIMRETVKRHDDDILTGKITPAQYIILSLLEERGALCMTDVAHSIGVSTAATTGSVDRLVRDGYVQRLFEPGDRRIIKIRLTARGSELVVKIRNQRRRMIMTTFGKLSAQDRQDYLAILERIRQILISDNTSQQ